MSVELDRAFILFEQSRHELAEQELHQELMYDPENPSAHALLGLCLAERGEYSEATEEAQAAIRLAPDLGLSHYALASILQDRDQLEDAADAIREAIRLDPEQADYHGLLASIAYDQGHWHEALEAVEQGLGYDPEHVMCRNLRAMILVKLGRGAEANASIEAALSMDPENAITHANQGWVRLREGDAAHALEHFRAALQIDPDFAMAQQGVVEALKARYWGYQVLLRFFVWMGSLSERFQWAIIVGGFLSFWMLYHLGQVEQRLAPVVQGLLIGYVVFGILTWTAYPLFNLLLCFDRDGRLALTREQTQGARWIGACVLACLGGLLVWGATGARDALFAAAVPGLMMLPVAGLFRCRQGLPRKLMLGYTLLVGSAGLLSLTLLLLGSGFDADWRRATRLLGLFCFDAFLIGSFFSGLVTIGLMMWKARR